MIKISNSWLLQMLTKLLILLVIAKAISLSLLWYLPSDTVELSLKQNYHPKYQRVDFNNMLEKTNKHIAPQVINTSSSISITSMLLKGLYGTSTKGYAIVSMKATPKKTSIISIDEKYQSYTLKSIAAQHVIFEKAGKNYVLNLDKSVNNSINIKTLSDSTELTSHVVSRSDISFFAKNPKQIWKDISIVEVKNGSKISGFKVTRINSNSKFASLGIKRGDLIIRVNNITLESYKDAIEVYKNISKLTTIQIVVIRDNQEKELIYEIN